MTNIEEQLRQAAKDIRCGANHLRQAYLEMDRSPRGLVERCALELESIAHSVDVSADVVGMAGTFDEKPA